MAEEIIFKVSTDTGNSNAKIEELEKSLADSSRASEQFQASLKKIGNQVNSGSASIRDLNKAVNDYKAIAINAGAETPVGQFAINKAAELKARLKELGEEVESVNGKSQKLEGAMQIGEGVIAGYGLLKGAMALVGAESESFEKTLIALEGVQVTLMTIEKLRAVLSKESAAMKLIQSVRTKGLAVAETIYNVAVGATTGALKLARLAMLALPIVAIIAGITALVMWIVSLTESGEDLSASNDALKASYDRLNDAMDRNAEVASKAHDRRIALAKSQGASAEEIYKLEVQKLDDLEAKRKEKLQSEKQQINELMQQRSSAINQEDSEALTAINDRLKVTRDSYRNLIEAGKDFRNNKQILENDFNSKEEDDAEKARQKQLDAQKKYGEMSKAERERQAQLRIEEQRLLEDLLLMNIDDANKREIAQLGLKQKRELELTVEKYGEESETIKELKQVQTTELLDLIEKQRLAFEAASDEADAKYIAKQKEADAQVLTDKKANAEARLLQLYDEFEKEQEVKVELAGLELEASLANELLTADEKFLIQEQYNEKIRNLAQETADHEALLRKQGLDGSLAVASASIAGMQSLSDIYFSEKLSKVEKGSREELAIAKKQFEVNKKLQVAQATIQGIQATLAAYSSGSAIPVVGAVAGPVFAAAAALASLAQVAKVKNATFDSGATTSITPPSTNIPNVNDITLPPDQTTQTGGLGTSGNSQITIVDSDIKNGLNNLAKVESISQFG
jgi:hypothetical protein